MWCENMLENKLIRLFYFSGSGNTLLVAKQIKDEFQEYGYSCSLENMTEVAACEISSDSHIALAFPVAIQSTNILVWSFIENLPKGNNRKVFMFDTLESFSGGIVGPLKRILEKKGYQCIGAKEFKMPSSMKRTHCDESEIYRRMEHEVAEYVKQLVDGSSKWSRIPILSDIIRLLSRGKYIWKFTSKSISLNRERCIGCGLCVKSCPVKSIFMNGYPTIEHSVCISCMRCVNYCPNNSFLVSKKSIIQNRHGPVIELLLEK